MSPEAFDRALVTAANLGIAGASFIATAMPATGFAVSLGGMGVSVAMLNASIPPLVSAVNNYQENNSSENINALVIAIADNVAAIAGIGLSLAAMDASLAAGLVMVPIIAPPVVAIALLVASVAAAVHFWAEVDLASLHYVAVGLDHLLENVGALLIHVPGFSILGYELWSAAVAWRPGHDPLALDLDGDGIETLGQNDTLLFDHTGGNLVNGTGWVKGDDGFLVLDRNGNGLIDNGSELFGVDTVMSNGRLANSGFQALADKDSNHDGKIDSNDTVFASLRVWQDANEDGITDAGELKTLTELGIASINVTPSGGATSLGNGNSTSGSAAFTRTDGSTGAAYNLILSVNAYQREYKDDLPIPAALVDLPNMAGTGRVRDLIQAATRDPALAGKLAAFSRSDKGVGVI